MRTICASRSPCCRRRPTNRPPSLPTARRHGHSLPADLHQVAGLPHPAAGINRPHCRHVACAAHHLACRHRRPDRRLLPGRMLKHTATPAPPACRCALTAGPPPCFSPCRPALHTYSLCRRTPRRCWMCTTRCGSVRACKGVFFVGEGATDAGRPLPSCQAESASAPLALQARAARGTRALTWSATLASSAQSWATRCVFQVRGALAGPSELRTGQGARSTSRPLPSPLSSVCSTRAPPVWARTSTCPPRPVPPAPMLPQCGPPRLPHTREATAPRLGEQASIGAGAVAMMERRAQASAAFERGLLQLFGLLPLTAATGHKWSGREPRQWAAGWRAARRGSSWFASTLLRYTRSQHALSWCYHPLPLHVQPRFRTLLPLPQGNILGQFQANV